MSEIRSWRSGRANNPTPAPARLDSWRRELEHLALRLSRLSPSSRDPSLFASERSELCAALRRLARSEMRS